MKKKIILVFDAFDYTQLNIIFKGETGISQKILKNKTILGYSSGIYPTIWSSKKPEETDAWNNFYFSIDQIYQKNPINFENLLYNIMSILPSPISEYFSLLTSFLTNKFKIRQIYPPCFNYQLKKYFKYSDKMKEIINGNYMDCDNLFKFLKDKNISYSYREISFSSIYTYKSIIDSCNNDILIVFNSILDFLGHKYGPNSLLYRNEVIKIINIIKDLEREYDIIFFSDHGMAPVKKIFNPLKILKKISGAKLNKDFIVWLDSTMFKIWFLTKRGLNIKEKIIKSFENSSFGKLLNQEELKKYGINFKSRKYGDLIFVAKSTIEIKPNFFNIIPYRVTPGLHGYLPDDDYTSGVFYSNFLQTKKEISLYDIFPLIKNYFIKELEMGKKIVIDS